MKKIRARRRPGDDPPQRLADALAHAEVRQPSYRACRSCGRETCWIGARHARQPERPVRPFPTIEHPAWRAATHRRWQDRAADGADGAVLTPEVLANAVAVIRNAPAVPAYVIVDEAHYLPPAMSGARLSDILAAYRERKDP